MKIEVTGSNYEGAHFRGIPSPTDDTSLKITLVCDNERMLCDWILDNFSYGPDEDVTCISTLAFAYKRQSVVNGDGCGMVAMLREGDNVLFLDEEYLETCTDDPRGILDLGEHTLTRDVPYNSLNKIVELKRGEGA
jgi:hypothetical protein